MSKYNLQDIPEILTKKQIINFNILYNKYRDFDKLDILIDLSINEIK